MWTVPGRPELSSWSTSTQEIVAAVWPTFHWSTDGGSAASAGLPAETTRAVVPPRMANIRECEVMSIPCLCVLVVDVPVLGMSLSALGLRQEQVNRTRLR